MKTKGRFCLYQNLSIFFNVFGYDVVDGEVIFGNKTKMLVLMHQINNDLKPDDEVADITRPSINSFCD